MSMPPAGFGRAFDLSSLTKPKVEVGATSSDEATVENFMADYVGRSKESLLYFWPTLQEVRQRLN